MTKREVEEYIMSQIFPNASHEVTAQNVRNAFAPIVERVWTFLEGEIGDLSQLQTTDKQSVVNAINAVLSKLNHDITLTKQEIDNIGAKVGEVGKVVKTENETDALYVTDRDGNIVTKTNKEGFFATAIKILKDGDLTDILDLLKNVGVEGISSDFNDSLYVTDSNGYVFFSITKNASGEYELNYVGKGSGGGGTSSKPLEGYELFTIGTSSDVNGWWQKRVCELTGCTFDVTKNKLPSAPLSVGGTIQFGPRLDNGVFRTKNLINQGYITDDGENAIIIINSGNDAVTLCSSVDTIETKDVFDPSAKTYNPSNPIDIAEFSQSYLLSINKGDRDINAVFHAPNPQMTSGFSTYYYGGGDVEDATWGNTSNWAMDYNFKFSNAWKTTIDMLQRRFPRAHIFVMAAEIMSGDSSSYLLPNGTYDTAAYENTLRPKLGKHHAQVMKQIAEYYNVGFIDVCNNCGYSIVNLNTYKPVNNIHYYDNGIGYRLRGEQVATQLLSQILK